MEIRHLRYFVAVAEDLHFGRAAARLHMSQPPLTKRIMDVERELGVRLFDRTNRRVTLTPEGLELLPKAQAALAAFDEASACLRGSARARARRVRVGFPPDTSTDFVATATEQLRKLGIHAELSEATTAEQRDRLLAGQLDVGVLRWPYESRGLSSTAPLSQPVGVLMATENPLASHSEIELADLAGHTLIYFPRSMAPGLYDETLANCRAHGFSPTNIEHGIRMVYSLLSVMPNAIALSVEHGFTSRWASGPHSKTTWVPIKGTPLKWRTSAVWRTANRDPLTQTAAQVVAQALCSDGWLPEKAEAGCG
ncbi:LysR family transcriptional regulator [Nocardia sp. NPDC059239]|uniref:LysR family transcriptional regulator n=1 Tax=Nocardia sp. NPDC059239 TaxID=3346785 RepID=UPI00369217DB